MASFKKEHVQSRIENFTLYLQQQHLAFRPPELGRNNLFFIYNGQDLARVLIGLSGNITITAKPGKLKDTLLTWIVRELPSYRDRSNPHDLQELNAYRYLLLSPSSEESLPLVHSSELPAWSIRLPSDGSQLVELAELLGYEVYCTNESQAGESESLYYVTAEREIIASGDTLIQVLAHLIQQAIEGECYVSCHQG